MLVSDAIQGFILDAQATYSAATLPMIKTYLKQLGRYFDQNQIHDITSDQLKRYFVYLTTEYVPVRMSGEPGPLSGSALDNHWKVMRSFFKWAAAILGTGRPDLVVQRPRYKLPAIVPFTAEEVSKLLQAARYSNLIQKEGKKPYRLKLPRADRDIAIILVLLDTGLRIGEFCRLRLGDVNLEVGEVYVRPFATSKKSRPRTVYVGVNTRRATWKYIASKQANAKQDDRLFNLSPSTVQHMLIHLGKKAGVRNVHPHRFRHTFAITYLRNGGDIFTLQRILGHSSLDMVQHYLALSQADDEAAHKKASPVDNWRL